MVKETVTRASRLGRDDITILIYCIRHITEERKLFFLVTPRPTHSDALQSVGVVWTSDKLIAVTST
jgi:hypothetical protein